MAKLIFESAEILQGATGTTPEGVIKNITVEGVEVTLEPDTVNVEDNREIYESYTGRIVVRSKDVNFHNTSPAEPILGSQYVSTDGTLPLEGRLKLNGKIGSHDIISAPTYIQGHYAFDNGRLEVVLVAQASDVSGTTSLAVSDVTA